MMSDKEANELDNEELENSLYSYLIWFFNLDINYDNLVDQIMKLTESKDEINNDEKFKKFLKALFKYNIKVQDRRQNNFHQLVSECLTDGESRRFTPITTKNGDFVLELNLIKSDKC